MALSTASGTEVRRQERAAAPPEAPQRLVSLDAFRGFVMILMVSGGLGIHGMVAGWKAKPGMGEVKMPVWDFLARHTDHALWASVTFWDMIQPWFMFMVGAALAFSIANRRTRGQAFGRMLGHAVFRAVALVLLAVYLSSYGRHTTWIFTNVLAQIGLGYVFLFFAAWLKPAWQWAAALGILAAYWAAFALYPAPPANFDLKTYELPSDWKRLEGFEAHWEKNTNVAARADQWLLNLFPQYDKNDKPARYTYNAGGYTTLNFVPSIATMIFGLLAGGIVRSGRSGRNKILILISLGAAGLALGLGIEALKLCPIIKRIWTPSWALYAAGWSFITLAIFYGIIDLANRRAWAYPLVVVGMNSIAIYCMSQRLKPLVRENLTRHFGPGIYNIFGAACAPMAELAFFLVIAWLVLWWMYRRKVFIRI